MSLKGIIISHRLSGIESALPSAVPWEQRQRGGAADTLLRSLSLAQGEAMLVLRDKMQGSEREVVFVETSEHADRLSKGDCVVWSIAPSDALFQQRKSISLSDGDILVGSMQREVQLADSTRPAYIFNDPSELQFLSQQLLSDSYPAHDPTWGGAKDAVLARLRSMLEPELAEEDPTSLVAICRDFTIGCDHLVKQVVPAHPLQGEGENGSLLVKVSLSDQQREVRVVSEIVVGCYAAKVGVPCPKVFVPPGTHSDDIPRLRKEAFIMQSFIANGTLLETLVSRVLPGVVDTVLGYKPSTDDNISNPTAPGAASTAELCSVFRVLGGHVARLHTRSEAGYPWAACDNPDRRHSEKIIGSALYGSSYDMQRAQWDDETQLPKDFDEKFLDNFAVPLGYETKSQLLEAVKKTSAFCMELLEQWSATGNEPKPVVVHLDLDPQNVIITRDTAESPLWSPVIIDWADAGYRVAEVDLQAIYRTMYGTVFYEEFMEGY